MTSVTSQDMEAAVECKPRPVCCGEVMNEEHYDFYVCCKCNGEAVPHNPGGGNPREYHHFDYDCPGATP